MRLPGWTEFRAIYDKSGISMAFQDYCRLAALLVLAALACTSTSLTVVHTQWVSMGGWRLLLAVSSLSLALSGLVALGVLYYPLYRKLQMNARIENGLVYTLSYMAVLSAGGISIERIMERVSEMEENLPLKQLAGKFVTDVRLLGFDAGTALKDLSQRSSSQALSRLLESVNNTVQTSGDLRNLFAYEVQRLLQQKREKLKKIVGTLTYMGEIYVTLVVVGPILMILMLTILSVLGGRFGGSAVPQLNLLVFFGIPVLGAGFAIVLDTVTGGEE